ncbi:MAG TPA: PIG-L family deacetylase [Saprospiraceae bacterium]|nr:PIG-L family deacetylase [Saprospiraceae bacterium]
MVKKDDLRLLFFLSQKVKSIFSGLSMVEKPEGQRVLVIAPHPDDDVIGCGGTIRLHRRLGHSVYILYLSDGERGVKNMNPIKTAELRRVEAVRSSGHLDVPEENLFHLHLRDGDLINQSGTNYDFRSILEKANPDIIYLPSFCETHRDHYAANILLKNNLVRGATIAAYEVWTPLIPNRLVNISSVIDDKRNALMEHASQQKHLDYLEAALSLNRYRAAMFRKEPRYAEAFIYCTSIQYFELMMSVE